MQLELRRGDDDECYCEDEQDYQHGLGGKEFLYCGCHGMEDEVA